MSKLNARLKCARDSTVHLTTDQLVVHPRTKSTEKLNQLGSIQENSKHVSLKSRYHKYKTTKNYDAFNHLDIHPKIIIDPLKTQHNQTKLVMLPDPKQLTLTHKQLSKHTVLPRQEPSC